MEENKVGMSVQHEIEALALINIQDIFGFTLSAKDDEIEKRYGCERSAIDVAEKYLDIALKSSILEKRLSGWSIKYNQPLKDSEERIDKVAYFYDRKETESGEDCQTKGKSRTIPSIDFEIADTAPGNGVLPCGQKCDIAVQ